jgi:hypothetical protein
MYRKFSTALQNLQVGITCDVQIDCGQSRPRQNHLLFSQMIRTNGATRNVNINVSLVVNHPTVITQERPFSPFKGDPSERM